MPIIAHSQNGWQQVIGFGSNPGFLNMYSYVPDSMPENSPLVVVLHGCSETALGFATETGWNQLADEHKFYVLYAEQNYINNASYCFNWFQSTDNVRGQGEAESVKEMVDYMKFHYSVDSARVFVTGLSAGGAFTAVMMAAYPEVFNAGAVMAGTPYKSATDALSAAYAMGGTVIKSPSEWGSLVTSQNPNYTGNYPKLAVFQGKADNTVYPVNAYELMKQWTNVHQADTVADEADNSFNGNNMVQLKQYFDSNNDTVVQLYYILNMMHGISVDPGSCFQQGGVAGLFSYDMNFYSSFWAAQFFKILKMPYSISGPVVVIANQSGNTYSVPFHSGSTYEWTVPQGYSITSGQGTNQIVVTAGTVSGNISVSETDANGCTIGPIHLFIEVSSQNSIPENKQENSFKIEYNDHNHSIQIITEQKDYSLSLFDITGKKQFESGVLNGNSMLYFPSDLENGIYLYHISSKGKNISGKVTVFNN